MADFKETMKGVFIKGMEAISTTATSIAQSTKSKVNEMNMLTRRQEILSNFGAKAYELWKNGEQFPEELDQLLQELAKVDEDLAALISARQASARKEAKPAGDEPEETEAEADVATETDDEVEVGDEYSDDGDQADEDETVEAVVDVVVEDEDKDETKENNGYSIGDE